MRKMAKEIRMKNLKTKYTEYELRSMKNRGKSELFDETIRVPLLFSGFGIKTPEDVKNFSKSNADGIVIGSAIVEKIQEISKKSDDKHNIAKFIKDFCEEMIANLNS